MATLALATVGSAVGSALLPGGISVLGATLSGAAIGQAVGALAGRAIDQALFAPSGQTRNLEGPRLADLQVMASSEGTDLPRVYGRARLAGQMIWATRLEEEIITTSQSSAGGGKGFGGGGGGGGRSTVTRTEYRYYANFALALCEGEITRVGRAWADGKELDLSTVTYRVYRGTETQAPDSLIEAKEGAGNAPAYRGTAYIVFERLPLARFGNRIPQLTFEVVRAVDPFEEEVQAVTLIPGAGEFVYATGEVTREGGAGVTLPENVHTRQGGSDWDVAIDQLEDALANARRVSLIVSWFGSDLRAGHCRLEPEVEIAAKTTAPESWQVAGLARETAKVVSTHAGRPAYGGTPSDASVVAAIQDLAARGIAVTLTPFILMDVPQGNGLTDPYTGASGQPAYPWRGRITVDPAPGRSGSPDKTAAAKTQTDAFLGTCQVSDFTISGTSVVYTGPAEWSYRRLVLHYAHLAKAAGGVDAFLIGSELRGLTWVRDGAASYPFVAGLRQLAADVKAVLGPATKVTYAADWSEYFGHQPQDGTGDVFFHLDPLWSDANIDAVAIDCYWPLADWRQGEGHLDWQAGTRSIYDLAYLKGNIFGGEGYDWYYASQADRDSQTRTPITDGAYGKPWVFRYKDLRAWWQNRHYDRPGGVESATATAWVPESKPIWFTELGCPAVDRGANQPNVFFDPKSAESALPHYSLGTRDDLIQRRYLQAVIEFFDPSHPDHVAGSNPTSGVYGAPMVDPGRIYVYTWDARPYPAFPSDGATWGDAPNWTFGHWLNGRVADAPVAQTVAAILDDYGFADYDVGTLRGVMAGFVIDRVMSAREALQPLELAHFFDARESGGLIRFAHRGESGSVATLAPDDLVEAKAGAELFTLTRQQESELPASAKLTYISADGRYNRAVAEARRLAGASGRLARADLPIVMSDAQAAALAESWLFESWASRERARFILPPSRLALEPSDVVTLEAHGRSRRLRLTELADHGAREATALSMDGTVYEVAASEGRRRPSGEASVFGPALAVFLDLPLLTGEENPAAGRLAAFQSPWPGAVAFYRSAEASGFSLNTRVTGPATLGRTASDLPSGPLGRWDRANRLTVTLDHGQLSSVTELALLGGANVAAIQNADGEWEVIQFRAATLVGTSTYELSDLLRGQAGTEGAMRDPVAAGARFVLLDGAIAEVAMTADEIGLPFNWKYGPAVRDIGHASYRDATHAFAGIGLRPLSPVHVRARRTGAGSDLVISWTRRTRIGGDSWAVVEVPLAEDSEAYEIDILDGATVKRTLSSSGPSVTYSEADQVSDWGAVQPAYTVRVCQMSAVFGRGSPAMATIVP